MRDQFSDFCQGTEMNASSEATQLLEHGYWPLTYLALPTALALGFGYFRNAKLPEKLSIFSLGREKKDVAFQSMGAIESLTDLKWETEEPRKIYKFSPKYFLTMGKYQNSRS